MSPTKNSNKSGRCDDNESFKMTRTRGSNFWPVCFVNWGKLLTLGKGDNFLGGTSIKGDQQRAFMLTHPQPVHSERLTA